MTAHFYSLFLWSVSGKFYEMVPALFPVIWYNNKIWKKQSEFD
jgi:hypothetical protein